ncbi:MAG: hypothetical protein IAG13_38130 [Deltaproteobacteria bacterium]|nr:hypothetical protein [Nannocystaceae bacterium]
MSSSADSSTSPVTTIDETSGPSTSVSTGPSDSSSSGGSTTSTTEPTGGGAFCAIDLPPSPGCGYLAEPGIVAAGGGAPSGWGEPDELLADEAQAGGNFIEDPDAGGAEECDSFAQNCPADEKCTPWANDGGGSWNATRCSPLSDAPVALGGACTVEGSGVSGVDNCEVGSMCWGVDADTLMGECVELCSCTPETPVCNTPNTACVITNQGALALCLGVCNPLDPEACEDGSGCFAVGELFHCAADASGSEGAPGDPCAFVNACDPGSFCAGAALVPGCAGSVGCCSAFCSVEAGDGCLAGQECLPWFAEGQAPDDCLGELGACSAP